MTERELGILATKETDLDLAFDRKVEEHRQRIYQEQLCQLYFSTSATMVSRL